VAQRLRNFWQSLPNSVNDEDSEQHGGGAKMIKRSAYVVVTIIFLLTAQKGVASQPIVTGHLEGVELCAQFQCGFAVFVGLFKGEVNKQRGKGGFLVRVNHESLPAPGQAPAAITGGEWDLRVGVNLFQGDVVKGTIVNNGNNTFTLNLTLQVTDGGSGEIIFTGILDHSDFPPTVEGDLAQPPAP
jgi:hypothetical protein